MTNLPKTVLFIGYKETQNADILSLCRRFEQKKVSVDYVFPQGKITDILLESNHDIILLNFQPNEQKIFGALKKLFKIKPQKSIIVLAGKEDKKFYSKAMKAGVSDFLITDDLDFRLLERAVLYAFSHSKTISKLRESESKYKDLVEHLPAMFYISEVVPPYSQIYASPLFARFGYDLDEWLTVKNMWQTVIHPDDKERILEETNRAMAKGKATNYEYRIIGKDGKVFWVHDIGHFYRSADGESLYWQGLMSDITERKIAQEELLKKVNFDELTGLHNRRSFIERLDDSIKEFKRDAHKKFAVFLLDMDRFKLINDTLGHLTGDRFLIEVARRLEKTVEAEGLVSRLSGDEFSVLIYDAGDLQKIENMASDICRSLSEPVELDGYKFSSSASIGVTISDQSQKTASNVLRNADVAMYAAKVSGKNCCKYYDEEMYAVNLRLVGLENEMRDALERGEFSLHYQPIVSLKTGEICQLEALLRWHNKVYGNVSPAEFIPIAEETGLINSIGKWVLEESCRQLKKWQDLFPEQVNLVMGVNISAKQIIKRHFIDDVKEILKNFDLSPHNLRFEITETTLLETGEYVSETINMLNRLGISISTDDFGTGYSSLSYLHKFPFEELKIDSCFVGSLDTDRKSRKIVRTMVSLARSLDLKIVAEGVETKEQVSHLVELGCDFGQGYYFAKPLPAPAVENMLLEGANLFFDKENAPNLTIYGDQLLQTIGKLPN